MEVLELNAPDWKCSTVMGLLQKAERNTRKREKDLVWIYYTRFGSFACITRSHTNAKLMSHKQATMPWVCLSLCVGHSWI